MTPHLATGQKGEAFAKTYLQEKGYLILHENWRKGSFEIDLIAKYKGMLIIVEVKTRSYSTIQEPQVAVNKDKQRTLIKATNAYLTVTGGQDEIRFDIISIVSNQQGNTIEHIEDAFRAYAGR